jgi:1-acyl-sn-glycerol-3-phosphate acyltransferase
MLVIAWRGPGSVMIKQISYWLDRIWRTLATGFCFAFFFLGALVISFTCFPLLYLWPGSPLDKARRARRLICRVFGFFVAMMEWLGLIRVSVHNRMLLQQARGCVVIANHPTLIDVVILMSLVPHANCVVKADLWHSPYLKWVMRATGFISNENGEKLFNSTRQALADGDAMIIFPEGSRTVPGEGLEFKRGVANIAVRTDAPILTVLIACEPLTLTKGEPWYRIPAQRAAIHLEAVEVFQPQAIISRYDDKPAAARLLTRYLQDYFETRLVSFYDRHNKRH